MNYCRFGACQPLVIPIMVSLNIQRRSGLHRGNRLAIAEKIVFGVRLDREKISTALRMDLDCIALSASRMINENPVLMLAPPMRLSHHTYDPCRRSVWRSWHHS